MVATLQSVKVLSINVPAILVTGKDSNGNEFGYRKSGEQWVDYYNECATTPERIRRDVFPNVQYVRYPINGKLEYKMSRSEWIENGCPLDLPKSVVEKMIETEPHPVDFTQVVEREIDLGIGLEWEAEMTARHADAMDEERTMREAAQ
jgi:hypothetical protein